MANNPKNEKNSLLGINSGKLKDLYSILGQVLDGIWFLETEKRVGFEKALEIDLAVWESFTKRETNRILSALLPNPESRSDFSWKIIANLLEQILKISLFNQSIEYEIERFDAEKSLIFRVTTCKTLKGMEKVGRPINQAQRICKDIGLTYYENMAKVLSPHLQVECLTIPNSYDIKAKSPFCAWKFSFRNP